MGEISHVRKTSRETKGREETYESGRECGSSSGSFHGGFIHG